MRRTAVALFPLALLVVGCGPASTAESSATDATIEPADVTTRIVGATPKQETILREILAGLGRDTRIRSVRVTPRSGTDAVAVDPHIAPGEAVRGDWKRWLVANAFADRSRAARLPRVAMLSDDGVDASSLDGGDDSDATPYARVAVTAGELEKQVITGATKSGARLVELLLLQPNNPALAIRLQVDDPASFLERRAPIFLSAVQSPDAAHYDGLYLEVVDAEGELVFSHSHAASEDGGETLWGFLRPDLAGCDPVPRFGGPPDKPPAPPCPTDGADFDIEWVPRSEVTTKVVGGALKQREVLREILSGLGPTRLATIELVTDVDKGWGAPPDAVGFEASAPARDGYALWQAELAGEVFARRSFELGLPLVAYTADKDSASTMLWNDYATPTPAWTLAEAEKALTRVAEIAEEHGATSRIRVFEPHRLAFAIELRVDRPAEFLLEGLRAVQDPIEDAERERYDGRYLKVVDAKGAEVVELGAGFSIRGDLAGCYGAVIGGISTREPPPCPAK